MFAFLVPSVTIYRPTVVEVLLELRLDSQFLVMCIFLVPLVTIY